MAESLNSGIELHDSVLGSVGYSGTTIHVAFEPAYVHKSAGRPGVDPGSGFVQNFVLEFEHGQIDGQVGTLPAEVFEGAIELGAEGSENFVRLPIDSRSPVKLTLHLAPDNRKISIVGERVIARAISDPEYLEEFTP